MAERILVRGELSGLVHAGRILGALTAVVGIVLGVAVAPWGWIVAGVGGGLWLVLESVAWRARRVRTWLTLHDDGMEIEDARGYRAIHDSQVSAVALETKKNLTNGELSSITRKFRVWAEDQPEPLLMENRINIGAADPLAGLIDRLLGRLRQQMEEAIARGGTASGDGWHLSRTALTLGRPPSDQQLPLSEITAIETFDGRMCIWQRGIDMAVAKLPLSGRNVHLLPVVVRPFLTETSKTEGAAAAVGLGRVLFERRPGRNMVLVLAIAGVALAASGAAMTAMYLGRQNMDEGLLVGGLVMVATGTALGLLGTWLAFTSFRCHERGVWKATLWGQKTLRYADLGSFQFSAVRHYHHGAYTGTHLTMRFRPVSADRGPTMRYTTRTQGDDDDLDGLRDYISRIIAVRMAEQIRGGQPVTWTANLEYTPEGIRFRPSGFLGRKEPQLLPFTSYGGYDLKQGVFHLFAQGQKKSLMTEQAAAENFYPGFALLLMLLHEPVVEQPVG